jgi:O-acetylhomoserine/O-acetylserine sulfhydrylase-like pyridoxal-dependent enzyme
LPVVRSSAFAFDTAHDYAEVLGGRVPGYSYSRIDNPTAVAFATAVAALEAPGADDVGAEPFGSGMAAISTALLSHLAAGDELIAPAGCYGGTWSLLTRWLPRWGIRPVLIDITDAAAIRAALTPRTKMIYAETIANPTLEVPVLADKLAGHPAVARVRYPGLASHPQHGTASALFRGGLFGSLITVDVHGGRSGGMAVCDALRTVRIASSLGSVHSKVSHAASTTHRQLDDTALAAAGISPGQVRLSVGVEDPEELLADLRRAFDAVLDGNADLLV